MDLDFMMVVDVHLKQSNQVGGSAHMEKAGLLNSIKFFTSQNLDIGELATDRHPMTIKHVRENVKDVKHSIDVWHVAKGLKKKLLKISSQKECSDLSLWIKSIINHLYWVAAFSNSAAEKQGQVMLEKWNSWENHLHDKHTHSGPLFPECHHPELEGPERKKKWLKGGTKLSVTLGEVLNSRQMLKDVTMLSTGPQTAAIEGFHSTLNHFAPKMFGFSFKGMLHRTKLAALHSNCNSNRRQATTKDGNKSFNLSFKKGRKEFSIQEIREEFDYCYVYRLMKQVISLAQKQTLAERLALLKQQPQLDEDEEEETDENDIPPPICSSYQKPDKAEAVDRLLSRYNTSRAVNMDSCD